MSLIHTCYRILEIDRSVAFYEALGFNEIRRAPIRDEAEKRAYAANAALMTLEVRRSNTAALELYRQFDYRAVGVRPNYYVDEGEDAIVMVKELKK